jgi:hypothetical protein
LGGLRLKLVLFNGNHEMRLIRRTRHPVKNVLRGKGDFSLRKSVVAAMKRASALVPTCIPDL